MSADLVIIPLLLLAAGGVAAYFFLRKRKASVPQGSAPPASGSGPIDLTAGTWELYHSEGVPSTADLTKGLAIPRSGGGWDMTIRPAPTAPLAGRTIRMRFRIEGATPKATEGVVSARVKLFVWQKGRDLTRARKRFWSEEFIELKHGEWNLEAAIEWGAWTSVDGQKDAIAFAAVLHDPGEIGFTFGGQSNAHGIISPDGPSTFTLLEYVVLP